MNRLAPTVIALVLGLVCSGCLVRGGIGLHTGVAVAEPDLIMISPGVYVIADYDEPVFYSDGYYYSNRGGVWYQSSAYTGGWVTVSYVPVGVRRIHQPHRYVHYRSGTRVRPQRGHQPAPRTRDHRDHRDDRDHRDHRGPAVRDHRDRRRAAPAQGPTVRDHRSPPPKPAKGKPSPPAKKDKKDKKDKKSKDRDHRR